MFRSCFQLSAGDRVNGGASSSSETSAGPAASSCFSVMAEHRLVQALRGCVVIRKNGSVYTENAEHPLPLWRGTRCLLAGGSRSLVGVCAWRKKRRISESEEEQGMHT